MPHETGTLTEQKFFIWLNISDSTLNGENWFLNKTLSFQSEIGSNWKYNIILI